MDYKYLDFRCPDPTKQIFNGQVCPCNISLNNPTGRGYMACPYGYQISNVDLSKEVTKVQMGSITNKGLTYQNIPITEQYAGPGNMFPTDQYSVPQLWPRQLIQIGYSWRS
jgi:hypothetical protein